MPRICIIGAGSLVFTTQLMSDILLTPELKDGVLALVDLDPARLELAHEMAEHLVMHTSRRWQIEASVNRREVLENSDYIITSPEITGQHNASFAHEIPLRFGVRQTSCDTAGPGGLFRALRILPVWLEILEDIEMLAPRAMMFNYTKPMPSLVLAGVRASLMPIIGLCRSVQQTSKQLAGYLEMPLDDLDWEAAGTSHLTWFQKLERKGEDLIPRLQKIAAQPEVYAQDPARFETLLHLGAFPSGNDGCHAGSMPYFLKRPDLVEQFSDGRRRREGSINTGMLEREAGDEQQIRDVLAGKTELDLQRSDDFASLTMEALAEGRSSMIYGNVLNHNLIENLPQDGVVEVACRVDEKGLNPQHFGALPPQLAALNRQHMAFHELAVIAVLEQQREAALHALMLDPLTAAVCSLAEIRQMFDALVAAQKENLPEFLYL